jgi:acid phosphatase family membrane protein YuiD
MTERVPVFASTISILAIVAAIIASETEVREMSKENRQIINELKSDLREYRTLLEKELRLQSERVTRIEATNCKAWK